MKRSLIVLGLAAVVAAVGCLENREPVASGVLYRHHFVGTSQIERGGQSTKLKDVLALPATRDLRQFVLEKLARTPQEAWAKGKSPKDNAALIKPLLEDACASETYVEIRGSVVLPEVLFAIQLDDARARLWNTNLWQCMAAWRWGAPMTSKLQGASGWEVPGTTNQFQFVRAGKWVLWTLGKPGSASAMIGEIAKTGRPLPALPTDQLLQLEGNWPALRGKAPIFARYKVPATTLAVFARGENLRTEAKLNYLDPLGWKYEPWRIPTNTISDPIVSFTLGQGVAPLLGAAPVTGELGLKKLPNQFCLWGQASLQGLTFATVPMDNPTNAVTQMAPLLPKLLHARLQNPMGEFIWNSNKSEFFWRGLPFIAPYLRPLRDGGRDFLTAGIFPSLPSANPPPPDLYAQVFGRTNLLYYDWEVTQERLPHARQLFQLNNIVHRRQNPSLTLPTQKWLAEVAKHLGNTVTEITLAGPKQLELVRKSHIGFTGFELVYLARLVESPGFPLRYEPQPTLDSLKTNLPPQKKK